MEIYVICYDGEPLCAYESRIDADREIALGLEAGEGIFSIETIELHRRLTAADAACAPAGDSESTV